MIEYAEWIKELERVQKKPDAEGMTTQELASLWKVSTRVVRERLGILHRAGRIKSGRKSVIRIDGLPAIAPVYSLLGAKKG